MANIPLVRHPVEQIFTLGLTDARSCAPSQVAKEYEADPALRSYPLYAIVRRPRIVIASHQMSGSLLTVTLRNSEDFEVQVLMDNFKGSFHPRADGLFYEIIQDAFGTKFSGRAGDLLTLNPESVALANLSERLNLPNLDIDLLDQEVLYVGKSEDINGAAGRRLSSHSTFQQILAHHYDEKPDHELSVILLKFEANNSTSIILPTASDVELDATQILDAINPKLTSQTRIALAEAGLIRLFNPHYNTHYKRTFPSFKHVSYDEVFQHNFNALGVVLDTSRNLKLRLFSEAAEPSFIHEEAWRIDPKRRSVASVEDILGELVGFQDVS